MPDSLREQAALMAGCIAGAEHVDRVRSLLTEAGFQNVENRKLEIENNYMPGSTSPPFPELKDLHQQLFEAYKRMNTRDLFTIEEVCVDTPLCDMPGPTKFKAECQKCGNIVRDKREVIKNNKILCKKCAFGDYYVYLEEKKN